MFYALKKSTSELQPPSGSPVPLQGGHWEVHTPPPRVGCAVSEPQRAASQAGAANLTHATWGTPTTGVPLGAPGTCGGDQGLCGFARASVQCCERAACGCKPERAQPTARLPSKPWGNTGPAARSSGLLQLSQNLRLCELGHVRLEKQWRQGINGVFQSISPVCCHCV